MDRNLPQSDGQPLAKGLPVFWYARHVRLLIYPMLASWSPGSRERAGDDGGAQAILARMAPAWRLAILPVMGGLNGWIVWRLAPQAAGHGTEAVIAAVHDRDGDIPFRVVPVKALATIISLAGGGSAGKEGPCTQIGSGLASALARLLRLSPADRRRLAICGIGAGFTAVFGTPLGGAIFAIEVLFGGAVLYDILFPSLVAGFTAYQVSQWFHVHYLRPSVPVAVGSGELAFLKALMLGALLGLVALALIETLEAAERFFHRLSRPAPVRPVVGGVVLVAPWAADGAAV